MLLKSLLHPVTAEHSLGQGICWVNSCTLQIESPEWTHGHHTVPAGVGCVPCVRTDADGSRICHARDKSTDLNFMVFMWILGWWDHFDQSMNQRTSCLLLLITASLVIIQLCKKFIVNFFLKSLQMEALILFCVQSCYSFIKCVVQSSLSFLKFLVIIFSVLF